MNCSMPDYDEGDQDNPYAPDFDDDWDDEDYEDSDLTDSELDDDSESDC